jgi:hypothetical protein
MSSERQVYVLYSVEFSSRILLPKVFGQCAQIHGARKRKNITILCNRMIPSRDGGTCTCYAERRKTKREGRGETLSPMSAEVGRGGGSGLDPMIPLKKNGP